MFLLKRGQVLLSWLAIGIFVTAGVAQASPVVVPYERFKNGKVTEAGLQLLSELQCLNCHAPENVLKGRIIEKGKLSLAEVGSRLEQQEILSFFTAPETMKKGSLMPKVHGMSDQDREALSHFLSTLKGKEEKQPKGDVEKGEELFHTIGCVACHEPAGVKVYQPKEAIAGEALKAQQYPSVPLVLAKHYSYEGLITFLKDPLKVRHGGRMPRFEMNEEEVRNLASYLQKDRENRDRNEELTSLDLVKKGKQVFESQSCMACHDGSTKEKSSYAAAKELKLLNENMGCLSANPISVDFALSEEQRLVLQQTIKAVKAGEFKSEWTPEQKVDAYLTAMNCYACHQQRGKGGLDDARSVYFTVHQPAAHSLGEIGMLPPKLDDTGRKLTVEWMEKLLWGEGGGVRPYMTARMPKFGEANVKELIPTWVDACKKHPETQIDTTGLLRHHRSEFGRQLLGIGDGGLGCVSCHGLKDRDSLGVPVIKLTQTVDRLTPEYFKDLLLNPQAVQPGTLMPPLFAGRKKADQEIEQIWTYLKEVDQFRLPEGLIQMGDYELKPAKHGKPIVFRTFLEGAGTHAIAVGFPQGVHAAFDAYEIRWTMAWKGKFVDSMSTWEERQMTPAKPLEAKPLYWSEDLPFASSADKEKWPKKFGFEQGYEFLGYKIAADGIPTLRYKVGGLVVEDTLKAEKNQTLRRILRIKGGDSGWWYKNPASEIVKVKDGDVFEEVIQL